MPIKIAKVTCVNRGNYEVWDGTDFLNVTCRGRVKKDLPPVVGDEVEVDDESTITKILTPKNHFDRPPISNIDLAFIVSSLETPKINDSLICKLITIFQFQRITPKLIFTKADMVSLEYIEEIRNKWTSVGYEIFFTKLVPEPKVIDEIVNNMKNKFVVFTGESGVGKSTLINNITDNKYKLIVSEISKKLKRGKQTTRINQAFKINNDNSFVIDTTGFSYLGFPSFFTKEGVRDNFLNLHLYLNKCKYSDCFHILENGCKLKSDVEDGKFPKKLFEVYVDLQKKLSEDKV